MTETSFQPIIDIVEAWYNNLMAQYEQQVYRIRFFDFIIT